MATEMIRVQKNQEVTTIILNRPEKRNAMNAQLIAELTQAVREFSGEASMRVLLIRGEGEHFCAGADISVMQKMATATPAENLADAEMLAELMFELYQCPKPTIVLAQGATMGGGLGLLAACDIAVATADASFGFSEVKIGLAPAVISPYVLAAIGERAARYYFLTGEKFGAEEALRIGLVQQVCSSGDLAKTGELLANTLLANSASGLVAAKALIAEVSGEDITSTLSKKTASILAAIRTTPDAKQRLQRFLEGKKHA